jgi:hypothetical protein
MTARNATKKLSTIENAEKTLAYLQEKHTRVAEARAADEREMGAIAFAAHSGDQKASAKLETLKDRALRRDLDLKSVDSAIAEAKRRVAAAQEAERQAEEERIAGELQELARMLRAAGKKCDAALKQLTEGAEELRKIVAATNERGLHNPSAQQLQSLGSRAVLGAMVNTPFARDFQHLAPRERTNFVAFAGAWAQMIERATAHKLKGGGDKAA